MEIKEQLEKDFGKVVGYEPVKLVLERILDMIRNREKYDRLGTNLPTGILLSGNPGTGKTLIANSFIEASGLPVYLVRKDKPNVDFINFINQSFESAKANAPAIVFLDDMDKFANEDKGHSDTEEYITIQSCIDDAKGKNVFVLATANNMDKLPRSLYRNGRFDKHIKIKNPTGKDAIKIVEYYIKQKNFESNIDREEIARMLNGGSCATLETVINEASVLAGFENKQIVEKVDLLRAAMCVIFGAPELEDKKPIEIVKKTAYHEAGHVVVGEILESGSIALVSVLGHDGPTQGVTAYYQDNDLYFSSIEYMKNRVKSLLAGKAAIDLIYGEVDVGACSDIDRAFDIVERFVTEYCSVGFDKYVHHAKSSDSLLSAQEINICVEVEKYYQEAHKMLVDNKDFLDKIAKALIEKETLTCKDIKKIKQGCKIIH